MQIPFSFVYNAIFSVIEVKSAVIVHWSDLSRWLFHSVRSSLSLSSLHCRLNEILKMVKKKYEFF